MHIPQATNKYQSIINKFKNDKNYRVIEDRNGWIALYKGINQSDRSGKDELVRRIVNPDGSEQILLRHKISKNIRKLFMK